MNFPLLWIQIGPLIYKNTKRIINLKLAMSEERNQIEKKVKLHFEKLIGQLIVDNEILKLEKSKVLAQFNKHLQKAKQMQKIISEQGQYISELEKRNQSQADFISNIKSNFDHMQNQSIQTIASHNEHDDQIRKSDLRRSVKPKQAKLPVKGDFKRMSNVASARDKMAPKKQMNLAPKHRLSLYNSRKVSCQKPLENSKKSINKNKEENSGKNGIIKSLKNINKNQAKRKTKHKKMNSYYSFGTKHFTSDMRPTGSLIKDTKWQMFKKQVKAPGRQSQLARRFGTLQSKKRVRAIHPNHKNRSFCILAESSYKQSKDSDLISESKSNLHESIEETISKSRLLETCQILNKRHSVEFGNFQAAYSSVGGLYSSQHSKVDLGAQPQSNVIYSDLMPQKQGRVSRKNVRFSTERKIVPISKSERYMDFSFKLN